MNLYLMNIMIKLYLTLLSIYVSNNPGIIYFGKEALNTHDLPLYASKQMHNLLQTNQLFSVMYRNGNIKPIILDNNDSI
jgi:hypothetical protein